MGNYVAREFQKEDVEESNAGVVTNLSEKLIQGFKIKDKKREKAEM